MVFFLFLLAFSTQLLQINIYNVNTIMGQRQYDRYREIRIC